MVNPIKEKIFEPFILKKNTHKNSNLQKMEGGSQNRQEEFSTDLLRVYYGKSRIVLALILFQIFVFSLLYFPFSPIDRLFPYQAMFNWFSYGNDPEIKVAGRH